LLVEPAQILLGEVIWIERVEQFRSWLQDLPSTTQILDQRVLKLYAVVGLIGNRGSTFEIADQYGEVETAARPLRRGARGAFEDSPRISPADLADNAPWDRVEVAS
jgi:hypothetical protein